MDGLRDPLYCLPHSTSVVSCLILHHFRPGNCLIHHHWLRERAEKGQLDIKFAPSKEMIADGLTKSLGADQFNRFRTMVKVFDVEEKIKARKRLEIKGRDLQQLEDMLGGGEASFQDLRVV